MKTQRNIPELPVTINWLISGRCNAHCPICYGLYSDSDLEFSDCKEVVEKIAASGIKKITLTGGEPLLYEKILDVIKYISDKGLAISLHTNGLLLKDRLLDRLALIPNLRISLALDGPTDKVNQDVRGIDSFAFKFAENIKAINKRKIPVSVKTTATKVNIGSMNDLAVFLNNFDLDFWFISEFMPLGRGGQKENRDKYLLEKTHFPELMEKINNMNLSFPVHMKSISDQVKRPYFFINSQGRVTTTDKNGYVQIGDIFEDNIADLWRKVTAHNPVFNKYFKDIEEIK